MSEQIDEEPESEGDGDSAGSRTRSKIAFPYTPLRDAEAVAAELQTNWPGYASPEQLAAGLGQSPTSGTFRNKVATARIFGAVTVTRGAITLTALGKSLADPKQRDRARVEAFLHVPLYKAIFESHKTVQLPADPGLEKEMVSLGVPAKQTDRARQTFQRSADQAGFFKHGRERLVQPAVGEGAGAELDGSGGDRGREKSRRGTGQSSLPAAVEAAWITLLDEGASWSSEEVVEWVALARRQRLILQKRG